MGRAEQAQRELKRAAETCRRMDLFLQGKKRKPGESEYYLFLHTDCALDHRFDY
jgi:hypothetical protein